MSGLRLAALYGWRPHQLGFCGPKDDRTLLRYLKKGHISEKKVKKILEGFEGAHPYYQRIARSNNIKNPYDERVVRAYWVGNELLNKVGSFKSHHSHHVLAVGSVTGRIVLKGKLLDLCRVGWGKVKSKVKNQKLKVEYQPLIRKESLKLGKPIKKEIDWDKDLAPDVKVGDWISFHWNQAAEILSDKDRKNLEKYTKMTLNSL